MLVLDLVASVCPLLALWELRERIGIGGTYEVGMLIRSQDVGEVLEEWMRKGFGSYKRVEEELAIVEVGRCGNSGSKGYPASRMSHPAMVLGAMVPS